MKAKVLDASGTEKSSVDIKDSIFGIEPNIDIIHQAVVNELANKRIGTACTKERGEVKGSTKKPWRQKGTGRARSGSAKSPIWRGGGTVFGPKPRDYSYSLPKKMKHLSIRSILSKRMNENRVQFVEDIKNESKKTKEIVASLESMSLIKDEFEGLKNNKKRKKARNYRLTIITNGNKDLVQSCRNIPWVECMNFDSVNAYDLFYSHEIMIEQSALPLLEAHYTKRLGKKYDG